MPTFILKQYLLSMLDRATSLLQRQTMTEAEHNRPIPQFFGNRPSTSAAEVFGETIGLVINLKISLALRLSPYF